ncbi:hypothetical protein [Nocardia bovistercoris]|uniref:Uncharacterized protein n=1 Tax=Nocardia bovistercoris TaxID=2785916 RepID=A0A931IF47_9NOCA|nr:hypothetical protein [Nocardia bovistercoris]MBH0778937.1 hypothetical protein [Nocardia bovistercoris]
MLAGALVSALSAGRLAVFGMLAVGQFAAHAALSGVIGHEHGREAAAPGLPGGWMVAAHVVATVLCGVLVLAARRLYDLVSTAVAAATSRPGRAPMPTVRGVWNREVGAWHTCQEGAAGPRAPPVSAR